MKHRLLIMLLIIALLLPACSMRQGDDLLRPPKLPAEYSGLMSTISKLLSAGAAYSPPTSGENRQSVQLRDIDGDGAEEAIVFLKTQEDPAIRVLFYKLSGDDYTLYTEINGTGDSIHSVAYVDFDGSGRTMVIIGYKMGNVKALSVYAYYEGAMYEKLSVEYSEYTITELTNSGKRDLLILRTDPSNSEHMGVTMYEYLNTDFEQQSQSQLSVGLTVINRVITGVLRDGVPAVYIAGQLTSGETVTDIFCFKNDKLTNITINPETGVSNETTRYMALYAGNIDKDSKNVLEIPCAQELPLYDHLSESPPLYMTSWRNYSSFGRANEVLCTYHTKTSGWYLVLPDEWLPQLTAIARDITPRERATTFALTNGDGLPPSDLLTIYTITRSLGESVDIGSRILLYEGNTTTICAKIVEGREESLTIEELGKRFNIIESEWQGGGGS